MVTKIRLYPQILIRSEPGREDWQDFCWWVRLHVWRDEAGYAVYRPRDHTSYPKVPRPDADRIANEWNIANADRPLEVFSVSNRFSVVRVDGAFAEWRVVKLALGILLPFQDLNVQLPDPETLSDEEIVETWGIDYALWRKKLERKRAARKQAIFDKAVVSLEKKIGRMLTEQERDAAENLHR